MKPIASPHARHLRHRLIRLRCSPSDCPAPHLHRLSSDFSPSVPVQRSRRVTFASPENPHRPKISAGQGTYPFTPSQSQACCIRVEKFEKTRGREKRQTAERTEKHWTVSSFPKESTDNFKLRGSRSVTKPLYAVTCLTPRNRGENLGNSGG